MFLILSEGILLRHVECRRGREQVVVSSRSRDALKFITYIICPQGLGGAVHYAELQATMSAQHNSTACLAGGSCLPLGGHSVW